jgi:hypothetical protein
MSIMDQPETWNCIRMWCCRCNTPRVVSRATLEEYDKNSEVFLCEECKSLREATDE